MNRSFSLTLPNLEALGKNERQNRNVWGCHNWPLNERFGSELFVDLSEATTGETKLLAKTMEKSEMRQSTDCSRKTKTKMFHRKGRVIHKLTLPSINWCFPTKIVSEVSKIRLPIINSYEQFSILKTIRVDI